MPNFANIPLLQQYFDDIESCLDGRILQKPQIIEPHSCEAPAPFRINRGGRPSPIFRGSSFDFNKHQAIAITKDEIDFAAVGPEVGGEELQAEPLQVSSGGALAQLAVTQVERQFGTAPPGG